MDPITASLVAALAVGAAAGITETGKQLIPDAYNALKAALQQKFGVASDLGQAVDQLHQKPESKSRAGVVQEEIESAGAARDPELLKLAEALQAALKQSGAGDQDQATLSGSGAIAQGDGASATAATGPGSIAIGSVGGNLTLNQPDNEADNK